MKYFLSFLLFFFSITLSAQQFKKVDFTTAKVALKIDPYTQKIAGEIKYDFTVLAAIDTIAIEAQHMEFDAVTIDGKPATYLAKDSQLQLLGDFSPQEQHTVAISYRATPQKAMYFMGWDAVNNGEGSRNQVWTQGQGKYTSNWLPSFDDVNEKVIFDLAITFPTGYEVIANGKLNTKKTVGEHTIWSYEMQQPMSSYLLAIVAGDYSKKTSFSANNIPLEFYYYPTDEAKFEPTYRHSKTIFDFLESEIGVAYPWQNYKQIPVKDFLYAGMENTGTTVFSDAFVVDSTAYTDRNYSNVNAHELAHQWFGNLVTAREGKHHWLQEGFATYYALLAERELLGEGYFYYKLYESAEQLDAQNRNKKSTPLLDPKASSLTFYQRGAWALFALHNIIGAAHFRTAVQDYLKQHQFKSATTSDFITLASVVSGMDLRAFQATWLEAENFPAAKALQLLEKSAFMKQYLTLAKQRTQPLLGKKQLLEAALQFPANEFMGQEAVYQLAGDASEDALVLYTKAFDTNNLLIRQGIATTCTKIPRALRPAYETLLDDASYATIEAALYHLWVNFPENRKRYLEKTKAILGFNDKNVRTLWLVLAINTPAYQPNDAALFYKELVSYTAPRFSTKTRENAFTYLEGLQTFSDTALLHLIAGATHHHWRFRNACRTVLEKLLQEEQYQKKYEMLHPQLSDKQRDYLNKQLNTDRVR